MKDHEPRRLVPMRPKHCGRGVAMWGQKEYIWRAKWWRLGGYTIIFPGKEVAQWGSVDRDANGDHMASELRCNRPCRRANRRSQYLLCYQDDVLAVG